VTGLPPAAPDLGERAGVAEDLSDLGLALRDAQVGQFRSQLGGGAVAAGAAGECVQAGAADDRARPRHEVHQGTLPLSAMDKYDRPVGIGPLITVDTTAPVDVAAVAVEVRRLHTS
jgi:hypothetical protein